MLQLAKPAKVRCPIGLSHESRIRNVNKLATKCSIAIAIAMTRAVAVAVAVVCTGAMATLFFLPCWQHCALRDRVDILCKTKTEKKKNKKKIFWNLLCQHVQHVGAWHIFYIFFGAVNGINCKL